ncbi:hypothetical protein MSAN_00958600 [Mycena sanguinolenta]|uniref:DUF6593 domain-containing protein n=1 Tax=Mycena sanguinolenta TaxID=230812 RepID=A0A8H6YV80_9AGAR|nr:hypothetical protein MSAN_00958600 [Mycena sanguinolenta]
MHLILSNHQPLHCTYTDANSGLVQYKAHTPIKLHLRTTLSRLIDSDIPRRETESAHPQTAASSTGQPQLGTAGRFGLVAEFFWGKDSTIRFGGQDLSSKSYLRKEKVGWLVWEYIFKARDGKEYRWALRPHITTLKVNDASGTVVAEYRDMSMGIMSKARPASFEVFSGFEHMVDEVLSVRWVLI